jgi:hypothetical protein
MFSHALAACALIATFTPVVLADAGVWQEYYDATQNKKYYAHSETRETVWEPPPGVEIKYMDDDVTTASTSTADSSGGGSGATVLLALGMPMLIVFGGLWALYLHASNQGLADVMKALRSTRDRSQKRRSTKAKGGNYRPKFKLSQDGKGGRSANS